MKSKQINFFVAPDEFVAINGYLKGINCNIYKKALGNVKMLAQYDIGNNKESIYQVCLLNDEYEKQLYFNHIESSNSYYIDILKSYCVEFSIGGFYPYSDKELNSSRLYYVCEYYEKGKLIQKDKEFIVWADKLLKSFKKQFLKKSPFYPSDFVSDRFLIWVENSQAEISIDGTKFILK